MRIVEIVALENGAHRNQTMDAPIAILDGCSIVPDGWAVIPDGMETENFPFGEATAEEVNGVMTVTNWTPGTIPEPEPEPTHEPTAQDDTDAMMVDHEYRLTLLELGVTEGV